MATTEFWQRLSASMASSHEWESGLAGEITRTTRGTSKIWMLLDAVTIFGAAMLATLYELHTGPVDRRKGFLARHADPWPLDVGFCWRFCADLPSALIITSRRLNLYTPTRLASFSHEQRLSVQACFTSGLLLTGTLYLVHAEDIPRSIVLITVVLVTIGAQPAPPDLSSYAVYRRFDRGVGTRNVLIVGTGPEAHAAPPSSGEHPPSGIHIQGLHRLPGCAAPSSPAASSDVVGTLDTLFQHARKQFVDEIFFTTPCERGCRAGCAGTGPHPRRGSARGSRNVRRPGLEQPHRIHRPVSHHSAALRPRARAGSAAQARARHCLLRAGVDLLSPLLLAIAIAIKLDSPGPVFYLSERIGKKGRVFRCIKFRTMVRDAEKRRADIMHMNERDGVLFKISNDPRITRLGRFLRKYSLDELPQFFNVLRGDMSVVGPRPPLASEVREYKLSHLRRLDVTPGITGLWQVQGRQDPSFASYVSLDVTYIENWSIWLDFKIIMRTIGVVFCRNGKLEPGNEDEGLSGTSKPSLAPWSLVPSPELLVPSPFCLPR